MAGTFSFYATAGGRQPVRDYLRALEPEDRERVTDELEYLGKHGPNSDHVDCKHLEGKLWELRVKARRSHRVFYVTISGQHIVYLHAITKKTQKTPKPELDLAKRRAKEVL